jgi:hypothetical protein
LTLDLDKPSRAAMDDAQLQQRDLQHYDWLKTRIIDATVHRCAHTAYCNPHGPRTIVRFENSMDMLKLGDFLSELTQKIGLQ